jgi:hypothetical protein
LLELKTSAAVQQQHSGGSLDSVRAIMNAYDYCYGVFLDLGVSHEASETTVKPMWTWLEAERTTNPEAEPVYRVRANLEALMKRGREEERRRYPGGSDGA